MSLICPSNHGFLPIETDKILTTNLDFDIGVLSREQRESGFLNAPLCQESTL